MPHPRFYCPSSLSPGQVVALPDAAARHATRVLRLAAGDPIVLFNGEGGEHEASIESADRDKVLARVLARRDPERESPLQVTLAQALCNAEKMDLIVQKAVELGAARIQPLVSARSVARLSGERAERRLRHWRSVAIAACEQCGRNRVPEVLEIGELSRWLGSSPLAGGPGLLLSPAAERPLSQLEVGTGLVTVLIGPEGGFTPDEEAAAGVAGFQPVRLGPRVLRTETAGLAALAALAAVAGDF
jgi:16S rRNA (uracil1498-N3)-methyltransferase